MEEKLKKQRNKLFTRIILVLLAAWLTVSAIFCAVRLNNEKVSVQSDELANLSGFAQMLTLGDGSADYFSVAFIENSDFVYDKDRAEQRFDSQMIITDRKTKDVVFDTAGSIGVNYCIILENRNRFTFVSLLEYNMIRNALSDEEYHEIETYLNTKRDDGNYYELICTKLQYAITLIPLELKIVLINGSDPRLTVDDDVKTYDLSKNKYEGFEVYNSSPTWRNTVPKDFLFDGAYNKDYIGALTKKEQKSASEMISTGAFEYLFYASDYLNIESPISDESGSSTETDKDAWRIQYAKKVNLLDNCKTDLAYGVALIFFFFLTIAVILCVMIWRTVKAQIIGEQKRIDLTNALAHDIKTPLFVISGYAYSLKEDIDESERGLYIDNIIEQTDVVNDLVRRMLDYSKLDSYSMTLNKTEFDLGETVEKILGDYTALPDHKTIAFTHSGDNTISADEELLKTALKNLIDNALKYSLPDSEIQIDVKDKSFSIANKSEPLSKAELKELWQPYVRKDKSRHQKGNGLGLSIVKSILDLHGAKYAMEMKDDTLVCRVRFS